VVRSGLAHQLDAIQTPPDPLDSGTGIPESCGLPCYCSLAVLMQDCGGLRSFLPYRQHATRTGNRLRVMLVPQVTGKLESSARTRRQVCSWLA
jgi:hypothetical protein